MNTIYKLIELIEIGSPSLIEDELIIKINPFSNKKIITYLSKKIECSFSDCDNQSFILLEEVFDRKEIDIHISISTFHDLELCFSLTWEDFLGDQLNLSVTPKHFYILEEKLLNSRDITNEKLENYKKIISFINILSSHSDHNEYISEPAIEKLVFLHKNRIEIPISYSLSAISKGVHGIDILNHLFADETHIEQKSSIFKEALFGFSKNTEEKNRLNHIISHSEEFISRVIENYQLFVSEFSFEDVRREYEERKREYIVKLNEVFNTVQGKLLGIPISLALFSFKSTAIINDITFFSNFLILVSIIAYCSMMIMLIENQKHTLGATKSEYTSQMLRLKHLYADQYEKISSIKSDLDTRYKFQKDCLNYSYILLTSLFIIVLTMFFYNLPWKDILGI